MKTFLRIIIWILMLIWGYSIASTWIDKKETNIFSFYFSLTIIMGVIIEVCLYLKKRKKIEKSTFLNILTFTFTFYYIVLSVELSLRFFAESLQGHNEKNGDRNYHSAYQIYLNPCDSCSSEFQYVNQRNSEVEIGNSEFLYKHKYNGYGLRDKQFKYKKDTNEFRILGLGDSFTEGVGTTTDSTWLKQLERKLNKSSGITFYTTMNAGVHGSDLFFAYQLLERCLLVYNPDLVILDLNSTDIGDVSRAGGFERFDENGNFIRKQGPWWEFAFGCSYIVRWITLKTFHYDWQFDSPNEQLKREKIALKNIAKKINQFQSLANKTHFKFLLVLQPLYYDLLRSDPFMKLKINSDITKINLYPYFKEKIINQKEPLEKYYWPIDGHFNSFGYCEMSNEIYSGYFKKDTINYISETQF